MTVQPPKEIPRAAAGNTDPVPPGGADPAGNGGDPNGGTPANPAGADPAPHKPGDSVDLSQYVPKADYEKLEGTNKHLYGRATKAEGRLKEKGIPLDDPAAPPAPSAPNSPADPISIVRQANALRDFDDQELDFAATLAQGKNVPVTEAIKTVEFETYLKGKRGADFKSSKVPVPGSGGRPTTSLPDAAAIGKMSKDEHAALEDLF